MKGLFERTVAIPVRYEMLEPMKRWRLTADGSSLKGHAAMDVTFEAQTPPIGADGQNRVLQSEGGHAGVAEGHFQAEHGIEVVENGRQFLGHSSLIQSALRYIGSPPSHQTAGRPAWAARR